MQIKEASRLEIGEVISYAGWPCKILNLAIHYVGFEKTEWVEMTLQNTYNGEVFIADIRGERNMRVSI